MSRHRSEDRHVVFRGNGIAPGATFERIGIADRNRARIHGLLLASFESMNTLVVAVGGVGTYSLDFRTPLLWVALAFGLFSVVGLMWMALCSIRRRYAGQATRCPVDGRDAHVIVARGTDGRANDVVRCSKMSPPSRVTCGKTCLASIGRA